jgi:argininosuccinate lyase
MAKSRVTSAWHKRLPVKTHPLIIGSSSSAAEDGRLVTYDLRASAAHVRMLARQKIITRREARRLLEGLRSIKKDYSRGRFVLRSELEDVHMNIEHRLRQLVGSAADKLHTARSRNDLIATDLRLCCRDCARRLMEKLIILQQRVLASAGKYQSVVISGYTHLQPAQPVSWAFYMLSHFFRFQRDFERLADVLKRINVSPLGSCALAGTRHNIDPVFTASRLGFERPADNGLDAVSDRDFMTEVSAVMVSVMMHVAGMAEDIILYSSQEFRLVELDDAIATGSSIMPQKKNPDVFELLRGQAGRSIGDMTTLLCILKGLPSSYNRDLQSTKGVLFRQVDETSTSLDLAALVIGHVRPAASDWPDKPNLCCATDIVDYLVIRMGSRFREAYSAIASCAATSKGDVEMFIRACAKSTGLDTRCVTELLKPRNSVAAKISKGSTGTGPVRSAMQKSRSMIVRNKKVWAGVPGSMTTL